MKSALLLVAVVVGISGDQVLAAPAVPIAPAWLHGQTMQRVTVPCEADCTSVLTTCMEDVEAEPPADLIAECVSICRNASSKQFYGCLNRDAFCGGLFPCMRGE